MSGITIQVFDRTPMLFQRLQNFRTPRQINAVIARAGQQKVREHLFNLDRTRPNAMGGKRTHFYGQAARATHSSYDSTMARVSISKTGIAQRFFGGPIDPSGRISQCTGKPIRNLAIPARSEAYGKSPCEFDNLFVQFGRGGVPRALVPASLQVYGKKGQPLKNRVPIGPPLFWLVKHVDQRPDPTVLPTDIALRKSVQMALLDYYRLWLSRQKTTE